MIQTRHQLIARRQPGVAKRTGRAGMSPAPTGVCPGRSLWLHDCGPRITLINRILGHNQKLHWSKHSVNHIALHHRRSGPTERKTIEPSSRRQALRRFPGASLRAWVSYLGHRAQQPNVVNRMFTHWTMSAKFGWICKVERASSLYFRLHKQNACATLGKSNQLLHS